MGKMKDWFSGFFRSVASTVRAYLAEAALCLVYFCIFVFSGHLDDALWVWFVPNFVLVYTLHQFKDRNPFLALLFVLSLLTWIPLLSLRPEPDLPTVVVCNLLGGLALILGTSKMDNYSFGRNIVQVVVALAEGLLIGVLIWLLLLAIFGSVCFLFALNVNDKWFEYPSIFLWVVVTPLICCSLLGDDTGRPSFEKLFRIVIDKVLSPALVIYAVILYLYLFRILIRWELPDGGVAYMVLGFLGLSLVCYLLRLQVEDPHFEWFFKAFPIIAAAPLILLWIGVFRRVMEYGVTDIRFYLLLLCALVTLFIGMLVSEHTRRFQWMAMILGGTAVLFTFVPGIRARDFGIRSQQARLEKLLPDVLVDGRFPEVIPYPDSLHVYEDCLSSWLYLMSNMDTAAFKARYDRYGEFNISAIRALQLGEGQAVATASRPGTISRNLWSLSDLERDIDLGPYTLFVTDYAVKEDSLGVAFVSGTDTLLYCPVLDRLDKADLVTPLEYMLEYENGMYKGILSVVIDYRKRYTPTNPRTYLFKIATDDSK